MGISFRKAVMLLRSSSPFSFSETCKEEILKYIRNLGTSKTYQDTDVPKRVIKENAYIFAEFLHSSCNGLIKNSEFPPVLKQANIR